MSWLPALAAVAAACALTLASRPRRSRPAPVRAPGWLLVAVPGVWLGVSGSTTAGAALLAVAALGWGGRRLLAVRRRRAEAAATADRVLEACDLLASELVAGQSPVVALQRAAEEWPVLQPVAETGVLGGDPAGALVEVSRAPGAEDLRLVAAAWAVAHRTGGGLADALARVSGAIGDRRATRRVVESELASARATARLVAALPVVMLVLGSGEDAAPWAFLLGHPVGLACLVLGLGFGFAGLWWIERIADEVTR